MSFNECKDLMNIYDLYSSKQNNFLNFVYSKIAKNTKNRFVEKTDSCVDILLCNHPCIKVIPLFKDMNKENLFLKNEISKASAIIKEGDFTHVYFVYPKNENFDKHIEVKVPKLEESCSDYTIKIIPYSLNGLIKITKKGKCNGNCNILCK
jgi:hypothetical protein